MQSRGRQTAEQKSTQAGRNNEQVIGIDLGTIFLWQ
jgi:hypothetical protein